MRFVDIFFFQFLILHVSHAIPPPISKSSRAGSFRQVSTAPFYPVEGYEETTRQLSRLGHKNPLEWKRYNPLSIHNATLDDQFALRQWLEWFNSHDSKVLNFRFLKLLENPTVDFSIINYKALKYIARLGNYKAVKDILERIPIDLDDRETILKHTLIGAAYSHNKELVRFLLDEEKILPNHDAIISAVKSGNLEITKLLLEKMNIRSANDCIRIYRFIKLLATQTGNLDLINFLEQLGSPETTISHSDISKSSSNSQSLFSAPAVISENKSSRWHRFRTKKPLSNE